MILVFGVRDDGGGGGGGGDLVDVVAVTTITVVMVTVMSFLYGAGARVCQLVMVVCGDDGALDDEWRGEQ